MRLGRHLAVTTLAAAAFAGCGGERGDLDAFCAGLEDLSDQVTDGELADDPDDAAETAAEIAEAAPPDVADAARRVADELDGVDEDDPEEVADATEAIHDELGDPADDICGIDEDEFAAFDAAPFCEALEELSDEIADGDRDDEVLEQVADAAPPELVAAVEELADTQFETFDGFAEAVRDELGDAAEEHCEVDLDEFAVAPTTTTTTETTGPETTPGDFNVVAVTLDPSGVLEITLTWTTTADLDLAVLEPPGVELSVAEPGPSPTGGEFGGDANANCAGTGGTEVVSWPNGGAQPGDYEIFVDGFAVDAGACGTGDYTLTIRSGGSEVNLTGSVTDDEVDFVALDVT